MNAPRDKSPIWDASVASTIKRPKETRVPKACFCLHMAELINHYRLIWKHLPSDAFVIVFASSRSDENLRIAEFARNHGYDSIFIADALSSGLFFSVVVSNHIGAAGDLEPGVPALFALGRTQVRMMYALGKAAWNFSDWNKQYHTILCFGPYHAEGLAKFRDVKKELVGYPRFDEFFTGELDRDAILRSLRCDPAKKTVVWLPTWSSLSSIDDYSDVISTLKEDYNLIAKVHPETLKSEPERISLLRENGIPFVETPDYDNVKLFFVADYVLTDYGGSIFGAVYTDRRVLLLNIRNAENDATTGPDSLDIIVRRELTSVDIENRFSIPDLLKNDSLWDNQKSVRAALSDRIIAPNRGCASRVAAKAIHELIENSNSTFEQMFDISKLFRTILGRTASLL